MSNFREIQLPEELCASAEKKFGPRFGRVDELIVFLLREITQYEASQMDLAEQKIIEERLRGLGYI